MAMAAMLGPGSLLIAQQTQPSGSAVPAPDRLGPPYIDRSFGFSLRPPAESLAYREKQFLGKSDVELVRFSVAPRQWHLTVQLTRTTRPLDTQMIIEGITDNLARFEQVKLLRGEPARVASFEGVRYEASFVTQGKAALRQQAIVRTKPTEYLALVLVTPLEDAPIVTPMFDRIVDSFELVRTEGRREQIREAIAAGTSLLQSLAGGRPNLGKLAAEPAYLRFLQEGKEIGFVEILEKARQVDNKEGLVVAKNVWLFMEDGGVTHLQHEMFVAADLTRERWDNRLGILMPPKTGAPRDGNFTFESGFRQDNQLIIKYTPEPTSQEINEKVIEVEPSFAPAPWDVLFPRLVDLKQESVYGFASYDTTRRGLMMQVYRTAGRSRISIDGASVEAFKIEESEGLLPPINEIHVDAKGRLLRVVAEPTEMLATTKQYVDRKYAQKVKESMSAFDALLKRRTQAAAPPEAGPSRPSQRRNR